MRAKIAGWGRQDRGWADKGRGWGGVKEGKAMGAECKASLLPLQLCAALPPAQLLLPPLPSPLTCAMLSHASLSSGLSFTACSYAATP